MILPNSLSQNNITSIPHQQQNINLNNVQLNDNINIKNNLSKSNSNLPYNGKYPKFKNIREELAWLEEEEAKYGNKVVKEVKKTKLVEQIDFSTFDDE